MGECTREEVEMFCLSHIIYCMMDIDTENLFIDWRVSSKPSGAGQLIYMHKLMYACM